MGWLGDELADQSGRGLAPRTTKDRVEERLFALRNNLFSELNLVFLDTTSLYFEGAGGQSLGQYGHSKDHRPDLKQVVLAVVIDGRGRPICSELWPGNTTDVTTLLPVIERLKTRFLIARIGIVADRGMISAATLGELEARRVRASRRGCRSSTVFRPRTRARFQTRPAWPPMPANCSTGCRVSCHRASR